MKPLEKKEKPDCSTSDDSPPQRPKRNTCQKSAGIANGLSWREETDLKKALYASLQENKRRNWEDGEGNPENDDEPNGETAEPVVENGVEECPKKAKVHAQRKFAQGSQPNSPAITPQKVPVPSNTTQLLPYKRPKTEDFLTFLCLRGTSILPPSLDFLNNCSKSDSSSDCRSLSPELNDFPSKDGDPRDRSKLEHLENGFPRKGGACRASSKAAPPAKKLNFSNSKLNKVPLPSKKRKLEDENRDPSSTKVSAKSKATALSVLKEKYKKQRLASDKKKLLPPKGPNSVAPRGNLKRNSQKDSKVSSKSLPLQRHVKLNTVILSRSKLSRNEKKLAVEKRKSLRSADVRPKRLTSLKKKTPWIRRAKLVPPIVDVESDSDEPEVIESAQSKKSGVAASSNKTVKPNVSDRLRSKVDASLKRKDRLTSRQMLLRKHMQNRLKNKNAALHTKNIRSRAIIKRTTKQAVMKNARKSLVEKRMSLRKDVQNKRVTRSATHQIEELFWSHPEKKTKAHPQRPGGTSKPFKKKLSDENSNTVSTRQKTLAFNKERSPSLRERSAHSFNEKIASSKPSVKDKADLHSKEKVSSLGVEKPRVSTRVQSSSPVREKAINSNKEHEKSCKGKAASVKSNLSSSGKAAYSSNDPEKSNKGKITSDKNKLSSSQKASSFNKELEKSNKGKITSDKNNPSISQKAVNLNKESEKSNKGKITSDKSNQSISQKAANFCKDTEKSNKEKTAPDKSNLSSSGKAVNSGREPEKSIKGKATNDKSNMLKSGKALNSDKEPAASSKSSKDALKRKSEPAIVNERNIRQKTPSRVSPSPVPAKISRRSLSRDDMPGPSSVSKTVDLNRRSSVDYSKTSFGSKFNKPSTSKSMSISSEKGVPNSMAKKALMISNVSEVFKTNDLALNSQLNGMNVTVNLDRDAIKKLEMRDNNYICNSASSGKSLNSDKNVQNNLNLTEPEKTTNKDISNLISLNLKSEESSPSQNPIPGVSGEQKKQNMKEIMVECSKELNVDKVHKKSHDKKSKKSFKDDKLKRSGEKEKTKKSDKSDSKSLKKHKDRRFSKDSDSSKKSHKKDISKFKSSNPSDVKKSSEKKLLKLEKNHSACSDEKHFRRELFKSSSPAKRSGSKDWEKNKMVMKDNTLEVKNIKSSISVDMNFPPLDVSKNNIDIHQPSCSKDYPKITNRLNSMSSKDTDDDSDYDLTLDEIIKLNALKNAENKSEPSSSSSKSERKREAIVVSHEGNQDVKVVKKDSDSDVSHKSKKGLRKDSDSDVSHKSKKDSESSKHKKDKDSSKSKNHSKDQKTPKKEEKSKKDSEKSLAKLLKREKSKSSKKDEKSKHKKDSNSSKSKKDKEDKEGSKSSKKEEKMSKKNLLSGVPLSSLVESSSEHSDSKKEKTKKDRSSSFDDSKSPKKKKKHSELKDIEKIKNMISKSSIMSEFSGFKEFKRKSSTEKSELKKSKKRKKLALLKQKKLSKKLSAKLLRKYSKKKGLKSKKKLKKELKDLKKSDLEGKMLLKSKKQKHKVKSDKSKSDHDKVKVDRIKNIESASMSVTTSKTVISSTRETSQFFTKVTDSQHVSFTNSTSNVIINNAQTSSSSSAAVPAFIIENVPEVIASVEALPAPMSHPIAVQSDQYMFSSANEMQGIVASEFSGVFEETFPPGAILLTTRDTLSQVPVFIPEITLPKTMADAATDTGEDDLCEAIELEPDENKNDEMSVGTQTITPVCSPVPITDTPPVISQKPVPEKPDKPPENLAPKKNDSVRQNHDPYVFVDINPDEIDTSLRTSKYVPTPSLSKASSQNKSPVESLPSTPSKSPSKPTEPVPSSSPASKPRRKNSIVKKSKVQSIVLPKGEPFPVDSGKLVSAPVYYPSSEEFKDPLEYIFKIQGEAAQFGICKIVPPSSFKPECKVNDDMRFTAHNQYIHKMLNRWGPNVQHTACIKKHLKSQKVKLEQAPLIGGIELDLSRFYHTVQQYGGLQQVIEKKKWQRVADTLRVPKTAQDRVTKLYDAYCRYLVSFDTLPAEEKLKLQNEVIAEHEKLIKRRNSDDDSEKDEEDLDEENMDCVSKGRSMTLSNFFRIARNTMNMWFKSVPSFTEVENEYWKLVTEGQQHVVVHAGNIDSSVYQSGFACNRNSPFAKHPWNLKILTNNSNSILRCMGPVSGVTIPTLHVGMLFTTGCWYRDPHSLPWIEYLHTGASKIWYGVPSKSCQKFRESMKKIMPDFCTNNPIWLPSDTAMVPPDLLVQHGASLSRTIQNSGQFVVIFPETFTSTICCGYSVSESVYFAPTAWLDLAVKAFQDIQNSCEPPAFSLERLLLCIANDPKTQPETLQKILPLIENIRVKEMELREKLNGAGLKQIERLPQLDGKDKKKKPKVEEESEEECEHCRTHCYISMVVYTPEEDETVYCLSHALEHIPRKDLKLCKLMYTYDDNELKELVHKIAELIAMHQVKLSAKKKSPKKKLSSSTEKEGSTSS